MPTFNKRSHLLMYPDPIIDIEMISGAMFLYFEQPIAITLPPLVITKESYELLNVIIKRQPSWAGTFSEIFNTWLLQQKLCDDVFEILNPLKHDERLSIIWTIYSANALALRKSQELIDLSGKSFESIKKMINPISASGELIRHIMLETFLELDQDVDRLFTYCSTLFEGELLDYLLVKSYLLRLQSLSSIAKGSSIGITNLRIWENVLNSVNNDESNIENKLDRDVISWEIFKNIMSPRLDPLDKDKAEYICKLLKTQHGQIEKLRAKCFSLADKLRDSTKLVELPEKAVELIKSDVQNELSELFELDKKTLGDFLASVFSDEKTWVGVLSFIAGIISGQSTITIGGAIAALSFVGSKSVQVLNQKRTLISQSPYGLAYNIGKKYK